jgi:hypothetical protein
MDKDFQAGLFWGVGLVVLFVLVRRLRKREDEVLGKPDDDDPPKK